MARHGYIWRRVLMSRALRLPGSPARTKPGPGRMHSLWPLSRRRRRPPMRQQSRLVRRPQGTAIGGIGSATRTCHWRIRYRNTAAPGMAEVPDSAGPPFALRICTLWRPRPPSSCEPGGLSGSLFGAAEENQESKDTARQNTKSPESRPSIELQIHHDSRLLASSAIRSVQAHHLQVIIALEALTTLLRFMIGGVPSTVVLTRRSSIATLRLESDRHFINFAIDGDE